MVGIKIDENYRYENAQLTNGVTVSAGKVTLENAKDPVTGEVTNTKKVMRIENARVDRTDDSFYFSVFKKNDDVLGYNVNNVPLDLEVGPIILEFITFVENDVAL